MASAQPGWAYRIESAPRRSQALKALQRALERATVVLETSTYEEHSEFAFFGSALMVLQTEHSEQMARLLSTDTRARELLDARLEQALTERLGEALATLSVHPTVHGKGEQVHISCELAGTIHLQIAAR